MSKRGGWRAIAVVLFFLGFGWPTGALAEKGPWTTEVAAGLGSYRVVSPGMLSQGGDRHTVGPALRVAVTGAVHRNFELGLAVDLHPPTTRILNDVRVRGLPGTFVERQTTGAGFLLMRFCDPGSRSRAMFEVYTGFRAFHFGERDHLRSISGTDGHELISYGLEFESITSWSPTTGISVGWLWSDDRVGLGVRSDLEVGRISGSLATTLALRLFTTWSFYP